MRKLLVLSIIVFTACQQSPTYTRHQQDSITLKDVNSLAHASVDSIVNATVDSIKNVTNVDIKSGYELEYEKAKRESPIQVTRMRFIEKEYSSYRDVSLSWKNVSRKKVKAVRFHWFGVTAFGDPADMGITDGIGGGFSDDPITPGKSDSGTWDVLSRNGDKIIAAWAYEVVFADGTKWTL